MNYLHWPAEGRNNLSMFSGGIRMRWFMYRLNPRRASVRRDGLTCHVTSLAPAQSLPVPPAPFKNVHLQTEVGGIWHEQGSQYSPGSLHVCAVQVLAAGLLSITGNALGFFVRARYAFPVQSSPLSCLLVQKITQRATKQQIKLL